MARPGTSLNEVAREHDAVYAAGVGGVGVYRKTLTFTNQGGGEVLLGNLPTNAIVTSGSGVWVTTAFNGSSPVINVGVAGTPAMFGSQLPLTAPAFIPFDDFALAAAAPVSTARNLVATIGGSGATIGSCEIVVGIVT
jgi:hypothetical protein